MQPKRIQKMRNAQLCKYQAENRQVALLGHPSCAFQFIVLEFLLNLERKSCCLHIRLFAVVIYCILYVKNCSLDNFIMNRLVVFTKVIKLTLFLYFGPSETKFASFQLQSCIYDDYIGCVKKKKKKKYCEISVNVATTP